MLPPMLVMMMIVVIAVKFRMRKVKSSCLVLVTAQQRLLGLRALIKVTLFGDSGSTV